MLTALDHVIIGVNDLAQATSVFSEKIGLVPRGGGTHHSGGTANRIILIGDTYLELITIQRPSKHPMVKHEAGPAHTSNVPTWHNAIHLSSSMTARVKSAASVLQAGRSRHRTPSVPCRY
ncbi:MAG: VOC family protein [Chloroflexi bacterium]|nr:MAG: VOC family protein [Chloroflexota bacterium]